MAAVIWLKQLEQDSFRERMVPVNVSDIQVIAQLQLREKDEITATLFLACKTYPMERVVIRSCGFDLKMEMHDRGMPLELAETEVGWAFINTGVARPYAYDPSKICFDDGSKMRVEGGSEVLRWGPVRNYGGVRQAAAYECPGVA